MDFHKHTHTPTHPHTHTHAYTHKDGVFFLGVILIKMADSDEERATDEENNNKKFVCFPKHPAALHNLLE